MVLERGLLTPWAAGLCILAWTLDASAQSRDAIQLVIADCAGVSGREVEALVALEVAPAVVLSPESDEPARTHGSLECRDDVATITVRAGARAAPVTLTIALEDHAPAARARLLALAIAESIATSRLEPRTQPLASQPLPATTHPALGLRLWLGAGAAWGGEPSLLAPAAAIGASYGFGWLGLASDVRYEQGEHTAGEVEVGTRAVSLALAPVWIVGGQSFDLQLGPAIRVGYAHLRGRARESGFDGDSVDGAWFGPCAQAALAIRMTDALALRLGTELGYATRSVRGLDGGGSLAFELGGVWFFAHAGGALRFGEQ